jgi:uncharacterized protein (TIGR00251 family)
VTGRCNFSEITDLRFSIYPLPLARVTWYREDSAGVTLHLRVVPRASRSEIAGIHDGALRIRIAAPPVDGAANRELVKFLAKKLKVPPAAVILVTGTNSKNKAVRIVNPSAATLAELSKLG